MGGAGQAGAPLGLGALPSVAALGLRSGDSRVFSQSSGTRDSPADASRPRGGLCPGLAPPKAARGRQGGSVQLPHLPHGPACHTRTLPSAIGLGQLCPPEIITSFLLLLLLLLLLQSPSSEASPPPQPSSAPSEPPSFVYTHGATGPVFNVFSCCYSSFPLDLGWLGEGEVSWGPWTPGLAPGAAGRKEQLCSQPSSHQHLSPGCCCAPSSAPGGLPAPRDWGILPPHVQSPMSLTCVPSRVLASCWGPECLLWGGSWLTLPSHRAQGSGCGAALPSAPLPPG